MKARGYSCSRQIAIFALLLWVATGCYVPIRQIPSDAREFFPDWHGDLVAGETSRADVLLLMGEPDDISPDEMKLTYRWPVIHGIIVVTQCTPPVEVDSERVVSFEFDEDGILRSIDDSG